MRRFIVREEWHSVNLISAQNPKYIPDHPHEIFSLLRSILSGMTYFRHEVIPVIRDCQEDVGLSYEAAVSIFPIRLTPILLHFLNLTFSQFCGTHARRLHDQVMDDLAYVRSVRSDLLMNWRQWHNDAKKYRFQSVETLNNARDCRHYWWVYEYGSEQFRTNEATDVNSEYMLDEDWSDNRIKRDLKYNLIWDKFFECV